MNTLAPICLFVYNRPHETLKTIESLKNNINALDSDLYIYSDAAKRDSDKGAVMGVREVISSVTGFKSVTIFEVSENKGLAQSVIDGISQVIKKHGKVIALEDDLITSPNFLSFMNQSLDLYEKNKQIISVSGCTFTVDIPTDYDYDVYFTHRMCSYGWGTWSDRWEAIDWDVKDYSRLKYSIAENFRFMKGGQDLPRMLSAYMKGRINSWAVRFCYHQYKTETYTVYPVESKVDNIGFDSKGTNTKRRKKYDVIRFENSENESFQFSDRVFIHKGINRSFLKKYSVISRIIANYLAKG